MGAPDPGMQAAEQPTAETLLTAFRTIKDGERQRHTSVLGYWLSIRGDKEFPPLHDLDPLEISDAGPSSILLELISGGQDAEIRYLGDDLKAEVTVDRIIDAPNPSLLSCIAKKLPIVAISRDFLAFEDSYESAGGWTRLWITLLPLSSCGSWVDYVYAFVSVENGGSKAAKPVAAVEAEAEDSHEEESVSAEVEVTADVPADEPEIVAEDDVPVVAEEAEEAPDEAVEAVAPAEEVEPTEVLASPEEVEPVEEVEPTETLAPTEEAEQVEAVEDSSEPDPVDEIEAAQLAEPELEPKAELEPEAGATVEAEAAGSGPGFSKLLEGIANLAGFYGQGVKVDPVVEVELPASAPDAAEPAEREAPVDEPEALELETEATELPAEAEKAELEPVPAEQPVNEAPTEVEPEEVLPEPAPAMEGSLESKLTEVRAKADEAQQARLRAVVALHEGLSAAYDFALDAETSPEEYLRLVEAQGLKIQLRAPMAPVAKLAFGESCDGATIKQLEAVLAWALKEELPRGSLLGRIEEAGGIAELLNAA